MTLWQAFLLGVVAGVVGVWLQRRAPIIRIEIYRDGCWVWKRSVIWPRRSGGGEESPHARP